MTFRFDSIADFLMMSGHGPYVWASYIITFLALSVLIVYPYTQRKQALIRIKRQHRIENPPQ